MVSSQHESLYFGLSMFQLRIARPPWLFQQVGEIEEIFSKSNNFLFYPRFSLWQQIFAVKSAVPGEQKVIIPSKYRWSLQGTGYIFTLNDRAPWITVVCCEPGNYKRKLRKEGKKEMKTKGREEGTERKENTKLK